MSVNEVPLSTSSPAGLSAFGDIRRAAREAKDQQQMIVIAVHRRISCPRVTQRPEGRADAQLS
jgi:hypothetical protein